VISLFVFLCLTFPVCFLCLFAERVIAASSLSHVRVCRGRGGGEGAPVHAGGEEGAGGESGGRRRGGGGRLCERWRELCRVVCAVGVAVLYCWPCSSCVCVMLCRVSAQVVYASPVFVFCFVLCLFAPSVFYCLCCSVGCGVFCFVSVTFVCLCLLWLSYFRVLIAQLLLLCAM